jgi:hypothetical protein
MSLLDIMVEQLAATRRILEDDEPIVPSWRIAAPDGGYVVYTRFDHDDPEQRARVLLLVSRFMMWKMATSFVLTAETRLDSEEKREGSAAILVIGVSRQERLGVLQRIEERDPLRLGAPEWLHEDQVEETYIDLLPAKTGEITVEEIAELTAIFGEDGEMTARRLI